ncbi:MAG: aminotransferase [Acidimicrobiia bacterium]|nr:MAG: aminotransferase [Acidimicrobiia bacterium]
MSRVSERLSTIGKSATMAVSDRARRMREEGRDVISFGAGEPDFPTPDHVVEAATAAARDPRNHKYTANSGLPELREAVAQVTSRDTGLAVDPQQVLITNGGKQAVFQALGALVDPGDEVLIPVPYWVTYPEAVRIWGGVPVPVPPDTGLKVTVERLERHLTPRTKVLVFVSPSNPTGVVYTPEETRELGRWAGERGLWVLTDDIYQHLVYGDAVFTSMPAVSPELEDRWVMVNGVAKTYAMTGWRVGWLIGPADVVSAAANLQSHATSNVANVSQRAALAALTGPMEPVWSMREAFDRRRRRMVELLRDIDGFQVEEPQGAFYCFPDVGAVVGRLGLDSTIEFASWLLEEAEVAVVPGEAFGAPGHVRLSYALSDEDLDRGLKRLAGRVSS